MTVEATTVTEVQSSEARNFRKSAQDALGSAGEQVARALRKTYGRSGLTTIQKQERAEVVVSAIEVAEVALAKAKKDAQAAVATYAAQVHAEIMELVADDEAAAEEYQTTH
jgi:hypothetical protein